MTHEAFQGKVYRKILIIIFKTNHLNRMPMKKIVNNLAVSRSDGSKSDPKSDEKSDNDTAIKLNPVSDDKYVQIKQLWKGNNKFSCSGT